ncbi:hypothetical protein [Streptomyces sp. NPDC051162]|uniref:hypothetical protein n=1 Tax=unclassified Streptomyces TaxID=2593676 RepID=UPI00342DEB2C
MSESAGIPSSSSVRPPGLAGALGAVQAVADHVPGAGLVKGAVNGTLDVVGSVSPGARRAAVYAGVGLLGAVGLVEWPVAAAGAAAVWLTQQRPGRDGAAEAAPAGQQQDSPTVSATAPKRAKGAANTAPKRTKGVSKASSVQAGGRRSVTVPIDDEASSGRPPG